MRPETNIPTSIEQPFPIYCDTEVIKGFGRGSSELGIPTANIPVDESLNALSTGIYYGWSVLGGDVTGLSKGGINDMDNPGVKKGEVFPMVMSIGWNPFYKNATKAAEVHIIQRFREDFYGAKIKIVILGYIRPELDYTTKEALIDDIHLDIQIALQILDKSICQKFKSDLHIGELDVAHDADGI